MVEDLFRQFKGVEGRLMLASRDSHGNAQFQIWFDYTRSLVNQIREGDLVSVQNFAPGESGAVYSVLSLTNVMPIHYALGKTEEDLKGYPGHVMEAAKNIAKDWKDQVNEPTEDVTKIVCEAVPTFLELVDDPKKEVMEKLVREESALPMPGEEARLLGRGMVRRIVNLGIDEKRENVFVIGSLLRDDQVEILVKVEDFLKLHFGIFGFTGVGKSNLLSTVIDRVLRSREPTKLLLFDVMDEYKGILFDQFLRDDIRSELIVLDVDGLPGPVLDYINNGYDARHEAQAVDSFMQTLLLPRSLKSKELVEVMRRETPKVLRRIRIITESRTVSEFLRDMQPELFKRPLGAPAQTELHKALDAIVKGMEAKPLTPATAKGLLDKHFPDFGGLMTTMKNETAKSRIQLVEMELKSVAVAAAVEIRDEVVATPEGIIRDLNDLARPSLFVFTAFKPEAILGLCASLSWSLYGRRRATGRTTPIVSFIADEGDMFIPSSAEKDSDAARAKGAVEMLARRGRKFGIGVGIATQRAAYLDTKTMGQLHTYFISKLPRSYDREAVSSAFGLSDEQFTTTFKFRSGEWLLASHDATGLRGVPIPIRAPNAEARVRNALGVKE